MMLFVMFSVFSILFIIISIVLKMKPQVPAIFCLLFFILTGICIFFDMDVFALKFAMGAFLMIPTTAIIAFASKARS